ncbi:MAG: DnaB-like helicase C-terminal domain-containing protein, partial [Verrucomicrobiota bacterium]|nr:DnaB-like helicase C-terminal domain-containing protein [Verrucomicrobiota bacterium]
GFTHLDKLTGGFLPGQMIVLAARPSVGKTSLAMNMVENMALDHGIPVAVFSLEMSREQLARRLLCSRAGVNLKAVRDGFIGKKDFLFLAEAANEFSEAPIFIDDTPALTIMELRARSRRLAQKHKVGMVVIDYLQLLRAEGRKIESRQQEIATISSGIKALAKELEVPILVLSQLNREVERRGEDATPRLSDLRESGSIEQDADVVALLVRRVTAPEPNQEDERHKAKLILAKQRSGPTGTVLLTFRLELTRYENFIPDDRGAEGMDLRSDVDNES